MLERSGRRAFPQASNEVDIVHAMPLSFLKKRNSPLWARIHSDDATRLRLKYDTYYHIFERQSGTRVVKDGKEFVMLSSNDYLGLSHHPKIKEAGKKALEKWGSSTTGALGQRWKNLPSRP